MVFFRWFIGLPLAAIITAGLFAMMAGLIEQKVIDYAPPVPYAAFEITADTPEEEENLVDRYKETRLKEEHPPVEIDYTEPSELSEDRGFKLPPKGEKPGFDDQSTILSGADIKFAPQYPENCRSRAAEGTVTVQFDITPEGKPVNIRIIESADRCFNRTVMATVSKWKYSPASRGGRAITRYGVVEVIRFELKE